MEYYLQYTLKIVLILPRTMASSPLLKQTGISWGLLATVLDPDILNIHAVSWSYGKLYVIYAGATIFNRYNYPL